MTLLPRVRRGLGCLVRSFLALLLALFLVEGAMRLLGVKLPSRSPNQGPLRIEKKVPESLAPGLKFTLKPNSEGSVHYPGIRPAEDRTVHYRINAAGFRDRDYAREKPAGTYRILVLGDSVTYGTGVEMEDTFPKSLERALAELCPRLEIEVLNCGVYAYNTRQEAALLRLRGVHLSPDLVLICATVTDASGVGVVKQEEWPWEIRTIEFLGLTSGLWAEGEATTPATKRMMWSRAHSYLVDFVANRAYVWLRGRVLIRNYHQDWEPGSPGIELIKTGLEDAASLTQQHGIELKVLMYPTLTSLNENYPYQVPTQRMAALCKVRGLDFVDLLPPLMGQDARALHAHAHDRHPNAKAHALVGTWLAQKLAPSICKD